MGPAVGTRRVTGALRGAVDVGEDLPGLHEEGAAGQPAVVGAAVEQPHTQLASRPGRATTRRAAPDAEGCDGTRPSPSTRPRAPGTAKWQARAQDPSTGGRQCQATQRADRGPSTSRGEAFTLATVAGPGTKARRETTSTCRLGPPRIDAALSD